MSDYGQWELINVDNWVCDICQRPATINLYRQKVQASGWTTHYKAVCGDCWEGWANANL